MIAGIKVAIVFQRHAQTAGGAKDADGSRHAQPTRQGSVEIQNKHLADVPLHPFIENADQKPAILHRPDGAVRDPVAFLITSFVVPLHNRNELDVGRVGRIAEEAVYIQRIIGIFRIDRTKDVECLLMLPMVQKDTNLLVDPGGKCLNKSQIAKAIHEGKSNLEISLSRLRDCGVLIEVDKDGKKAYKISDSVAYNGINRLNNRLN